MLNDKKNKIVALITAIALAVLTFLGACTFSAEKLNFKTEAQQVDELAKSLEKVE